jgi:cob(I)alamin adenosyltransferase
VVRLSTIYTRTGDDGSTALGSGQRVAKHAPRIEAYGTVDEANACIGVVVVAAQRAGEGRLAEVLLSIQQDLFDVGADLCVPIESGETLGARLRVQASQTARLERLIDEHNADLAPLKSFVLPGGTELAAQLHVARTVTRRAERVVAFLCESERGATSEETMKYLNRLSDLLFVLSRWANHSKASGGAGDVLWVPGANRTENPGA